MKLSIPKSDLQRGLGRIQSIVEKRNTMPILANVHLSATREKADGRLELAGTDLEIGIRSELEADVSKAGTITASAKKLYEIVRELPDQPVHLETTQDSFLSIRCARADFNLSGNAADEYPTLPVASPSTTVNVQAAVLAQMIERTMYAASADETRYNLNGVFVEQLPDTGKLRMVATDGHRLAYVDREFGTELDALEGGVIIPRKGLSELKRLVDEEDADELELGFDGNYGLVRKRGVTLVMRLIEGDFPNYRQVIPRQTTRQLVLQAGSLVQSLRRPLRPEERPVAPVLQQSGPRRSARGDRCRLRGRGAHHRLQRPVPDGLPRCAGRQGGSGGLPGLALPGADHTDR